MTIGSLAKQANVNIQTLRYYERIGILQAKTRRLSGYRIYDPDALKSVRFIKHAQELGFTLDEISELLQLRNVSKAKCKSVQGRAAKHLADVKDKITMLKKIEMTLESLISECKKQKTDEKCPLLDCLDDVKINKKENQ
jgi:Hg(II)-responsive transcriptional regulator